MRILVVCRYKEKLAGHAAPFVTAQAEAIADAGCEVELYRLCGNYWKQWKSLRAKIRDWKPDVVHAHYGLTGLVANLATRRVPVVSTYHGSDINEPKVLPFSKVAMWLSAWNIFVSQRNVNLAKPHKHWLLIPCGVELSEGQLMTREEARKKLGWYVSDKKILFAGAFDNGVKNAELAFEGIRELENEGIRDVELIELKGYTREQVNTLMCAVDALLMTSKTEGSPQVIKEAMACGCPIVSVDVGDVAERTSGVEGCYVVQSREPKVIAAALEKALAFEGKTKGREHILHAGLTSEQVAKRIIEIYKNILNNK